MTILPALYSRIGQDAYEWIRDGESTRKGKEFVNSKGFMAVLRALAKMDDGGVSLWTWYVG